MMLLFHTTKLHAQADFVLKSADYKSYIDQFNRDDDESHKEQFSNDNAWAFLRQNIALLDCPDKSIELTYYFRWWTYRKHIQQTPDGYILTAFLRVIGFHARYYRN